MSINYAPAEELAERQYKEQEPLHTAFPYSLLGYHSTPSLLSTSLCGHGSVTQLSVQKLGNAFPEKNVTVKTR